MAAVLAAIVHKIYDRTTILTDGIIYFQNHTFFGPLNFFIYQKSSFILGIVALISSLLFLLVLFWFPAILLDAAVLRSAL